ncbi:hypothetical protein BJX63DRAFT_372353 [Aspergillus granulosus]|uniref:Uncharacterized protein n=1 Tax=Aspergillus granulosus TaxID=176169 RepID=A0ABR4H101_9EURO
MSENRPAWNWYRSCQDSVQDLALLHDMGRSLIRNLYLAKPATGPQSAAARLARSRALHSAVETFWERMRGWITVDLKGSALSVAEIESVLQVASANLDNEYLEERQREEASILEAINRLADATHCEPSFPSHVESYSRPKSVAPRSQKTKATGGGQQGGGDMTDIIPPTQNNSPTQQTETAKPTQEGKPSPIHVSKQSLEVFLLMFPEKQAGEVGGRHVLWDEFVHAMVDAGFTARNSSGSAVAFTSSTSDTSHRSGGRIVFHKPHPVPKIDPILLQVMGKRMARWFDWGRELFTTTTSAATAAAPLSDGV